MLIDVRCINKPIVIRPIYLIIIFKVDSIDFLEKYTAVLHWIFFCDNKCLICCHKKTNAKSNQKTNKQTNKDCKNDFQSYYIPVTCIYSQELHILKLIKRVTLKMFYRLDHAMQHNVLYVNN